MEKEIQADLFEQSNKNKRNKRKIRQSFRKIFPCGFINIRFSYESIIFSLIVLLMLSVVLFSLGIERGKHLKDIYLKQEAQDTLSSSLLKKAAVGRDAASINKPERESPLYAKSKGKERSKSPERTQKNEYTVQVLTYKSKRLAQEQLQKLMEKGYKPFIIYSGGYYQICIGKYPSRKKAKRDLARLKKSYKDCFVRNIPKETARD